MWQQAHCNKELKHTWPIQLTDCNKWLQYKKIHTGLAISAKGEHNSAILRIMPSVQQQCLPLAFSLPSDYTLPPVKCVQDYTLHKTYNHTDFSPYM